MSAITVVIPSIRGREELLQRAVDSIREPDGIEVQVLVQTDLDGEGAAAARNYALEHVDTPLVAFLDDDDEFKPDHLRKCLSHMIASGSDIVYPWFDINRDGEIRNDLDPLLLNRKPAFGQLFDPDALDRNNFIPVTVLARTDLIRKVGGFPVPGTDDWPYQDCEDWGLWLALRAAGARFSHLPERTWTWNWHGKNTSGRSDQARKIYG
jgi:glycosyltransferase involved in cell wall biosynthesis